VDNGTYLHPWLIAVFLFLFALLSLIGMVRLLRERRFFGTFLLMLSTIIFAYSTWIAATLKV
jgi:ABC-type multidrug transport system permease subunit